MSAVPKQSLLKFFLLALAYFAAGKLGYAATSVNFHTPLLWLPSGIALGALLCWGIRYWPAIFLSASLLSVSAAPPDISALVTVLGDTLGPVLAALLLLRLQFNFLFIRFRDFVHFVAASALSAVVAAVAATTSMSLAGHISSGELLPFSLGRWMSDFVGLVLVTPILAAISHADWRRLRRRYLEFAVWLLVTGILSWGIFYLNDGVPGGPMPLVFTVQALLIWSALRFGLCGSSLGLLLPLSFSVMATHQGLGPFHRPDPNQEIFLLWLFLATLVLVQLAVATSEARRKHAEKNLLRRSQILSLHNEILGRINLHQPLQEILEALARQIEAKHPSAICSILLLDNERKYFQRCFAPNLPQYYNDAMEGLAIGEGVGCCGTAAFTGQCVVVEDITKHAYWQSYSELALQAGIRACWSQPILDHQGQVMGTFATYRRVPMKPSAEEISLIEDAARIAALAIERTRKEEALRGSEEKFHALYRYSRDGIMVLDAGKSFIAGNPAMLALLDFHNEKDLIGLTVEQVSPPLQADNLLSAEKWQTIIHTALSVGAHFFEWTYRRRDGSSFPSDVQLTKIELGGRTLLQGHVRDITKRKTEERQQLAAAKKMRYMIAASPTILFASRFDEGHLSTYWISENVTRILGYEVEETLHTGWWQTHIHSDDYLRIVSESSVLFEAQQRTYEYRFLHKNGTVRWIRDEQQLLRDPDGQIAEILNAWTDVTSQKREEEELRIAATTFETQEGIFITDRNNRIVRINRAFTELTGYSAEDVLGKTPTLFKSGRQDSDFYRQMWETLKSDRHWEGEIWNRRKNGEIYPEWLTITAIADASDQITHYVAAFSDISQLKKNEAEIHALAFYDPLTGLPNRRLLSERLKHARAVSHRSQQHGALIFLDLDHFKILNDTQGHAIGDCLLIETAQRLLSLVREMDTVSRLGGDEFVIMLENLHENAAEAATTVRIIAEKVSKALAVPYILHSNTDPVGKFVEHYGSASIGVTLFRNGEADIDELMKRADMAMYQAKRTGRNAICFFDPQMQSALLARAEMEKDLRLALDNHEFALHYQLQVDALGRPIGAEALLRWEQPRQGNVPPAQFIPLAEEIGIMAAIGEWALFQACNTLAKWAAVPELNHLTLAFNISARQFRQPEFAAQIQSILQTTGAKPELLQFEITESLVMNNLDDSIETMSFINELGVTFTLDDFGTGYSSLSYLQRLPLKQLKIDRSFIRDLPDDAQAEAIVRTVLALGKSLELTTIAEGVENERQHSYLAAYGCPVFQGYFYAKPMLLEPFETFIRSRCAG